MQSIELTKCRWYQSTFWSVQNILPYSKNRKNSKIWTGKFVTWTLLLLSGKLISQRWKYSLKVSFSPAPFIILGVRIQNVISERWWMWISVCDKSPLPTTETRGQENTRRHRPASGVSNASPVVLGALVAVTGVVVWPLGRGCCCQGGVTGESRMSMWRASGQTVEPIWCQRPQAADWPTPPHLQLHATPTSPNREPRTVSREPWAVQDKHAAFFTDAMSLWCIPLLRKHR